MPALSPVEADDPGQQRKPVHNSNGLLSINMDYFNLSAATGGDFYFWAPGEFSASAGLAISSSVQEPIDLIYCPADHSFSRTIKIPVDAAVTRVRIFAGARMLDKLNVFRPGGYSIAEETSGAEVKTFRYMRIIDLKDPEPGMWQAQFSGMGTYSILVRCSSNKNTSGQQDIKGIQLMDFAFVEFRGLPGHQDFSELPAPPRHGTMQRCRTTLSGNIKTPTIDLMSADGTVLSRVKLEEVPDIMPDEFIGTCIVPNQPFRVRVRGEDSQGWLFQRVTPGLTVPAGRHTGQ